MEFLLVCSTLSRGIGEAGLEAKTEIGTRGMREAPSPQPSCDSGILAWLSSLLHTVYPQRNPPPPVGDLSSACSLRGSPQVAPPSSPSIIVRFQISSSPEKLPRGMAPNTANIIPRPQQPASQLFSVTEVEPWLYLSGASVLRPGTLDELGITCLVSACPELPPLPAAASAACLRRRLSLDLRDTPQADLYSHLASVADIIQEERERGGRTLVHCVAGVSRSASLCLGYLVRHRGLSLEAAYLKLSTLRPCIRPNIGFFRQLIRFETELRGSPSVQLVFNQAAKSLIPTVYEPDYLNTIRYIQRGAGIK